MTTNGHSLTWGQKIGLVILTPLVLPASLILIGIPLLLFGLISGTVTLLRRPWLDRDERLFEERMRKAARALKIHDGLDDPDHGTVLIEWRHKAAPRIWWTDDDVHTSAPCEPPPFDQIDFLGHHPPHPFMVWCHQRFLDPVNGEAKLCIPEPPIRAARQLYVQSQEWMPVLPRVHVVAVAPHSTADKS